MLLFQKLLFIAYAIAGSFFSEIAQAQLSTGKITGRVVDSLTLSPIQDATIAVMDDSSGLYITYAVSNKKGAFTITSLPLHQRLAVLISHMGYRDTVALLTLDDNNILINSGDWALSPSVKNLQTITAAARRPPFSVRNDTLEFNATTFQSLPNDMVQDLLRKLPGVIMDEQGNIAINGKKVDKIMVDGRAFFSNNIKIVTQHLPGNIIDKVQVTATQDPVHEYSSVIKPTTNIVTLNLTLRTENKSGLFGQVGAAGGTAGRYQTNAFLNAFRNIERLSVMANTGNCVSPERDAGEQGSGLIKNISQAGVNFNTDIRNNMRLAATYTMNSNNGIIETILERINLLPDSSFLYSSNTRMDHLTNNHSLNAELKIDMDTFRQLTITPSVSFTQNRFQTFSEAQSTTMSGTFINSQQNENRHTTAPLIDASNALNYIYFSKDRKTVLTINWSLILSKKTGSQNHQARNTFTASGAATDSLNQHGNIHKNGFANNIALNINRSLSSHLVLILNYSFQQNKYKDDKRIYNFNNNSNKYDILDSIFSNYNLTTVGTHTSTLRLGYREKKFSTELAGTVRSLQQNNRIVWKDSSVKVQQKDFLPSLAFAYSPHSTVQLTTTYALLSLSPDRGQLDPIPDNNDPLLIKVGNPLLRSAITHIFNAQGSYISRNSKWRMGLGAEGTLTAGQITADARYDNLGRQVLTWRNVNGNRNASIVLNTSTELPFNSWRAFITLNGHFRHNRSVAVINGRENVGIHTGLNPLFNMQLSYKTIFNLQATGSVVVNRTHYSLTNLSDTYYDIKRLQILTSVHLTKQLLISGSMYYIFNSQLPTSYQRSKTFINAGIKHNFSKEKRLSVEFHVNDLLNNNINTTRTITSSSIETVQMNTLRRYYILSINYKIDKFR